MKHFYPTVLLFLVSISTVFGQAVTATAPVPVGAVVQNYILRPSDQIQVQIFQEPDLTRQTRIAADGMVHLVLIQPFRISGLTIDQAQIEIERRYYDEEFLWSPRASVSVLSYSPRKVSVLGEVARPGFVAIAPDRKLTLIEAISTSGDFSRLADKTKVQLKRIDPNSGRLLVYQYNVDKIINGANIQDIVLQDGDIISVPELRDKVNVLGHVNRPGFVMIPAQEQLTLVEAIGGAGGFTRLAKKKAVQLRRTDQNGSLRVIEVDVDDAIQNPDTKDIVLGDGDIIFVPEKPF
jgi:polysaccharide export outer membrane protein